MTPMADDDAQPTNDDHGLPILDQGRSNPWGVPEPGPSTLLLAIDSEQMPTLDEIRKRLMDQDGESVTFHGEPPDSPDAAEWAHVVEVEGYPYPLIVWVEHISPENFDAPAFATSARYMFGLQTMLEPNEPLGAWKFMVEVASCAAGSGAESSRVSLAPSVVALGTPAVAGGAPEGEAKRTMECMDTVMGSHPMAYERATRGGGE